jgi:hypothetical protein
MSVREHGLSRRRARLKRFVRPDLVVPAILLSLSGFACGETRSDVPSASGAVAGASSSGGAPADASCPAQAPSHGAPCQGAQSCYYSAFLGCFPSTFLAVCKEQSWDVQTPTPYMGPCPGDPSDGPGGCPETLPTAGFICGGTLDGPPRMFVCEYTEAGCFGKRVATCPQGKWQWELSPCEAESAAGAGGAATGGEGSGGESAGGVSGVGGAE